MSNPRWLTWLLVRLGLRCPHFWRPARYGRAQTLGRHCTMCQANQPLSKEEFYAHFGERFGMLP